MTAPRFVVGIDLGTTNCAIATADLAVESSRAAYEDVPQLVNPGEVAPAPLPYAPMIRSS